METDPRKMTAAQRREWWATRTPEQRRAWLARQRDAQGASERPARRTTTPLLTDRSSAVLGAPAVQELPHGFGAVGAEPLAGSGDAAARRRIRQRMLDEAAAGEDFVLWPLGAC